jgi:hypothetical protein
MDDVVMNPTGAVIVNTAPYPKTKYRCPNGHEWEATTYERCDRELFYFHDTGESFCMECFREWCRKNLGVVRPHPNPS